MGLSIGAVLIRHGGHAFNAAKIINDLFGTGYNAISEGELSEKKFDNRRDNCVSVYQLDGYVAIISTIFTAKFYKPGADTAAKVYQYFEHPAQIFAYEHYSSGDTYSYAIIEHGKLIRSVRQTADQLRPDTYGTPLNFELKIINAPRIKERGADGELYTYIAYPDNKHLFMADQLTEVLLREVMHHETGLWPDSLYDKAITRHNFMLNI